jgi:DNA-binding MarR family transcriptional regulator
MTSGNAPDSGATDIVTQLDEQFVRAFRRLKRGTARQLAPFGITGGQARALRVLGRLEAPLRVGDLAARLEIVPRSATAMVDALEAAGLVERRPDTQDRRSVLVAVTPAGGELLERMRRIRHESAKALFGKLTEVQRGELLVLLAALNVPDAATDATGRTV